MRRMFIGSLVVLIVGGFVWRSAAQSVPRHPMVQMERQSSAGGGGTSEADVVWTDAGNKVLTALQETGRFTEEDRKGMEKAQARLTAQQIFILRLDGLKQKAKR